MRSKMGEEQKSISQNYGYSGENSKISNGVTQRFYRKIIFTVKNPKFRLNDISSTKNSDFKQKH